MTEVPPLYHIDLFINVSNTILKQVSISPSQIGRLFENFSVLMVMSLLLISILNLFTASSFPFVLVPTLPFSLNNSSLVFTLPANL